MNSIFTRVSPVRTWIVPAVAILTIIGALVYLTITDTGRNLVGFATGSTVTCEPFQIGTTVSGTVSDAQGYECYTVDFDDPTIEGNGAILISLNSKSGSSLDADLYAPDSEVALGNTGYAWVTVSGSETNSGTLALVNTRSRFGHTQMNSGTMKFQFRHQHPTHLQPPRRRVLNQAPHVTISR